jgi:hypothetical protein
MGACDSINIIIRQTILQLIPPKDMLGRVAAINGIFVTSSNELGALQSSVMTRFFSVVPVDWRFTVFVLCATDQDQNQRFIEVSFLIPQTNSYLKNQYHMKHFARIFRPSKFIIFSVFYG